MAFKGVPTVSFLQLGLAGSGQVTPERRINHRETSLIGQGR